MNLPATVREFLHRSGGQYKARVGAGADSFQGAIERAKLTPGQVAQASVITTGKQALMIVHRAGRVPDLQVLEQLFKRPFTHCDRHQLERMFPDCDLPALPPLPGAFGLKGVIDPALAELDEVFFSAGRLGVFVRASGEDFLRLMEGNPQRVVTRRVHEPVPEPARSPESMKKRVQALDQLPAMPGIAMQILKLRNNPYSHVSELSAVVEQDPSLAAQIVRYASSPFFGYQGKVESVAMAIARVLGMDFVMDLAFGLSLGRSFRNPLQGPLGLNAFWQHATYSAALTQALCLRIPYMRRPSPGVAYLAGLLHNFGFLLLGHLFPEQFNQLNKAVAEQPERSITELEREVVGVTHCELGLWLAEAWNLPGELVEAMREHHNPAFRHEAGVYANLVYIANALLKRHGIGDGEQIQIPPELLEHVGLDEIQTEAALGGLLESRESLEFMARKMAA